MATGMTLFLCVHVVIIVDLRVHAVNMPSYLYFKQMLMSETSCWRKTRLVLAFTPVLYAACASSHMKVGTTYLWIQLVMWPFIHVTMSSGLCCNEDFTFLKDLCSRPGICEKACILFISSSTAMFLSFSVDGLKWALDWVWRSFSSSYFSKTGCRVPRAFPSLPIALSVWLPLRWVMDSLHSLFKCSIWRSHGMLWPGSPRVFTNLLHVSWWDNLGESAYLSWKTVCNASRA